MILSNLSDHSSVASDISTAVICAVQQLTAFQLRVAELLVIINVASFNLLGAINVNGRLTPISY